MYKVSRGFIFLTVLALDLLGIQHKDPIRLHINPHRHSAHQNRIFSGAPGADRFLIPFIPAPIALHGRKENTDQKSYKNCRFLPTLSSSVLQICHILSPEYDNHRKCQKAHSGIVSSRQGPGQARTLARRLCKKRTSAQAKMLYI